MGDMSRGECEIAKSILYSIAIKTLFLTDMCAMLSDITYLLILLIFKFPQLIKVTTSPSLITLASAPSMYSLAE